MRRTIIARSAAEVLSLRKLWESLGHLNPATLFQSFNWNSIAARLFAHRETPFVIYSENDNGAALLPCAVDPRFPRLTMLGESLFDYRDVLVAGDDEALQAAWNCASGEELDLSTGAVRNDSNLKRWREFRIAEFYGSPRVLPTEITADAFAAEHNRLGRWYRKLQRMGVTLRSHTGGESDLVRYIYERKGQQPSDSGENLFRDPLRQQFMVEVCAAEGSSCEIFTMESASTIVSALVTFRDKSVRRFYTVYYDVSWAKYSPGMCLVFEITRQSLAAGLECDYMTGEHGYKTRLATSVLPMYWVQAAAEQLSMSGGYRPAMAS